MWRCRHRFEKRFHLPVRHLSISGKISESNPITGQHFTSGNDLQLGAFDLLLDHHVGNSVHVGDSLFDFLTERIHFVEVFTEELDGDIGLRSREHGIDTGCQRLAYFQIDAFDRSEAAAYVGEIIRPGCAR